MPPVSTHAEQTSSGGSTRIAISKCSQSCVTWHVFLMEPAAGPVPLAAPGSRHYHRMGEDP